VKARQVIGVGIVNYLARFLVAGALFQGLKMNPESFAFGFATTAVALVAAYVLLRFVMKPTSVKQALTIAVGWAVMALAIDAATARPLLNIPSSTTFPKSSSGRVSLQSSLSRRSRFGKYQNHRSASPTFQLRDDVVRKGVKRRLRRELEECTGEERMLMLRQELVLSSVCGAPYVDRPSGWSFFCETTPYATVPQGQEKGGVVERPLRRYGTA